MTPTRKPGGKKSGTDAIGGFPVLGIVVSDVDYEAAVAEVIAAASERHPFSLSALAVHGVMTGLLDGEHAHRLNHIDLVVPDGQPRRSLDVSRAAAAFGFEAVMPLEEGLRRTIEWWQTHNASG